jgi:hypothetical protein
MKDEFDKVANWPRATRTFLLGRGYVPLLAVVCFLLSSLLVVSFTRLAGAEFGSVPGATVERCRWDCGWYATIVNGGYDNAPHAHPKGDAANWAFFPLFPAVAFLTKTFFGLKTGSALIWTGKLFLLLSFWAFLRLAERECGRESLPFASALLVFNPHGIYGHVGYTEPMYLFLCAVSFLALTERRWLLAGAATAAMSAVRLVGVLFLASYAVQALRSGELKGRAASSVVLGTLLCPLGLAAFMLYLHFHVGDALAFKHVQVAWDREVINPLAAIWNGLVLGGWDRYFASVAVSSLAMSVWLAYRGKLEYSIFLLAATLLPLSTGLLSMPRYVFWQVPFLLGLTMLARHRTGLSFALIGFAAAMSAFVTVSWFAGRNFVV